MKIKMNHYYISYSNNINNNINLNNIQKTDNRYSNREYLTLGSFCISLSLKYIE